MEGLNAEGLNAVPPNPFGLMMDPEAAAQALARLDQATQHSKRVCRPLDKPVMPKEGDASIYERGIDGTYLSDD